MGWPDLVDGWLDDQRRRQTESYIKRGRPLALASTEELMRGWIQEFRVWTQDPGHRQQAMTDFEVELTIRGEGAPCDKVDTEWKALRERSVAERRTRRRQDLVNFTTIPLADVPSRSLVVCISAIFE